VKLFLKGDRCYTGKCAISKNNVRPGQHGAERVKTSEYGLRLREKQKLRRFYGMGEAQFRRFFGIAVKMAGQTGHNFLQTLERRLDNVIYRMGLGVSRNQARQIVCHGHVSVNGRKVDVASFLVKAGDVILVREGSRDLVLLKENAEVAGSRAIPAWLTFNTDRMEGSVVALPTREQIDSPVNEQLVVEFYAAK